MNGSFRSSIVTKIYRNTPQTLPRYNSVVPFLLTVKPKNTGDLDIEILACNAQPSKDSPTPSPSPTFNPCHEHAPPPQLLASRNNPLLPDKDTGPIYDTLVALLTVCRPHLSLCVDQPVTLKAGSELFSVMLGPRLYDAPPEDGDASGDTTSAGARAGGAASPKRKIPFGAPDMMHLAREQESRNLLPLFDPPPPGTAAPAHATSPSHTPVSPPSPSRHGCKVFLQTAPGIRFLAQVCCILTQSSSVLSTDLHSTTIT